MHELFLGNIYRWAGKYRTIDLSSGNIRWCHAIYIPQEMEKYNSLLQKMTPISPSLSKKEIVKRIAMIHGELIVIHPFRDGNGRLTRLLCNLILAQAAYKPLSVEGFVSEKIKKEYYESIQFVWSQADHSKLEAFLSNLLVPF